MNNGEVRYDDPALHAHVRFIEEGFSYGHVIPRPWFMERFGLAEKYGNVTEAIEAKMLYAKYMGSLRNLLLINNKMALRTKEGVGQEVVRPEEQTEWAMREAKTAITKELERARDRITNVNLAELSSEEQRENADAIAKLSFFKRNSMKKLPW